MTLGLVKLMAAVPQANGLYEHHLSPERQINRLGPGLAAEGCFQAAATAVAVFGLTVDSVCTLFSDLFRRQG